MLITYQYYMNLYKIINIIIYIKIIYNNTFLIEIKLLDYKDNR